VYTDPRKFGRIELWPREREAEALQGLGMEPLGGTPEDFAADIKADRQHWATVIRDAGLPTR